MTNEDLVAILGEGWSVYEPMRSDIKKVGFAAAKRTFGLWTFEVCIGASGNVSAQVYRVIDPDKETPPRFGVRALEQARRGYKLTITERLGSWFLDLDPVSPEKIRSAVLAIVEKGVAEQECCLTTLREVQKAVR